MAFRYLNRPRGGSTRAFDADVLAWEAAVVANGGSVSLARRIILDQFVFSEKSSGAWALTDDYWGLWGENAPQALTSLKQQRLAVTVNSPTFTVDRGYAFDGLTSYLNAGFVPSTNAVAMAAANIRLGVYERTNVSANAYALGIVDTGNRNLRLRPRNIGNGLLDANVTGGTFTLPAADSRGLTTAARNGVTAADQVAYKNGVAMTRTADASGFGASLPTLALFIGGVNTAGALASPKACSVGFAVIGSTLSAAQELAQYNAVQAWATSVGAQV